MRLALYSDQLPLQTDPLDQAILNWVGKGAILGYLPSSPDPDRAWFAEREKYYARLGMSLQFFGVEDEFDPTKVEALFRLPGIHLTGGNTFQFLYWLRHRGLLPLLRDFALNGGVLIGVSAGAILMTPEVATSRLCGDVPYQGIDAGDGLGLVDFEFAPHYRSEQSSQVEAYSTDVDRIVWAVEDGGGLIVEGDSVFPVAQVCAFRSGRIVDGLGIQRISTNN